MKKHDAGVCRVVPFVLDVRLKRNNLVCSILNENRVLHVFLDVSLVAMRVGEIRIIRELVI